MPGLLEPNQVGKRQDLSDYITNIEADDYPIYSMLPKDKELTNTKFETQADDYGDTDDLTGVHAGKDADKFENQAANRGIIENYCMKMWENPMVDDFAENVSENPALSEGEYVEAVRKSSVRLKFRIEKRLLSELEATKNEAGKAYGTCSFGGFLLKATSAYTGSQVVPARFRTPAAQVYDGAFASLDEEDVQDILQELFESTMGSGDYTAPCGSELKQKVSFWSLYRADVASNTIVRRFDAKTNKTLEVVIDILTGDFGTVKLVPTTRMRDQDVNGAATTTAKRRNSGYILSMKLWGLRHKRRPGHRRLEDKGGGPRGIVDTIFGLRCKSPKGNATIVPNS
jgi:hypothetical protein